MTSSDMSKLAVTVWTSSSSSSAAISFIRVAPEVSSTSVRVWGLQTSLVDSASPSAASSAVETSFYIWIYKKGALEWV